MNNFFLYFKLLRLNQWSKAIFVLLGVVYSGVFTYVGKALTAALAFCLASSAVYIYNDLNDLQKDKWHPLKCNRPIVNKDISVPQALILMVLLLIASCMLSIGISWKLLLIIIAYLSINFFYNYGLKDYLLLDVFCIASGFMLRVLAGTIGIGLLISWWLTITATLISLLIALSKRRLEKQLNLNVETRAVLRKYSFVLLDRAIILTAFSAWILYIMYIIMVHGQSFSFMLTIPFAAVGLARFVQLIQQGNHQDDPLECFFKDNLSLINTFCFLTLTFYHLVCA